MELATPATAAAATRAAEQLNGLRMLANKCVRGCCNNICPDSQFPTLLQPAARAVRAAAQGVRRCHERSDPRQRRRAGMMSANDLLSGSPMSFFHAADPQPARSGHEERRQTASKWRQPSLYRFLMLPTAPLRAPSSPGSACPRSQDPAARWAQRKQIHRLSHHFILLPPPAPFPSVCLHPAAGRQHH